MKQILKQAGLMLATILLMSATAMAQFTATGSVSDSGGEPLIGVTVLVKGTALGTVTDFDGKYSVNVPGQAGILVFSYTGFAAVEQAVSSSASSNDISLSEDVANLSEVVVTGLASNIKRSNLANAISTIDAAELTEVTTQQTVDGALYGKLTGVNINANNGAPGGGIALRLRGVSSLTGNNQPLFVIDGVYISNAEIPSGSRFASGANSGTEEGASNRIADLNPEDIESIEVLKGASAAAIYGTRANAGVVIITTKKGKAGKTKISLEQDFGTNTIQNFVGRRQYTPETIEEQYGADARAEFEAAQAAGKIFDYEQEIYGETGLISDTRLSISGGSDKTQFYFNASHRDEDGIIKNTGYRRSSLRMNLNHNISDKLKISSNTNYVNSYASRSFTGNENEGGLSYGYNLAFTRDYVDLFPDEDGNYPNNPNASGNPLFVRDNAVNEENVNRLIQGFRTDYTFFQTDNLVAKLTGNVGIDALFHETFVHVPENHQAQVGTTNGFIGVGKTSSYNINYQVFGVLDYYASNGLTSSTQLGISYLNFDVDRVLNQTTQLNPLQTNLGQGASQSTAQILSMEEEFGFIVQEQLNWDDKVIGTVGVRLDKSSLNGDPNKYFVFPRASVAVNIANFDFWTNETINQLKFRAAYGETGSSATFGSLFTSFNTVGINGAAGFSVNPAQGDATLTPETSQETEFGLDIGAFNSRVGLEVTYYIRNVRDLLYQRSLPTSSGFGSEIRNDFDLQNKGLEIALRTNPVRTEKFDWSSTVNFWFNRTEVTRLGVPGFIPPGTAFGLGLGSFFVQEGEPITALWNNGDEGPEITGNVEPDFQIGWYNELSLMENLNVNFLLHWKQGGDVLNLSRLLTGIGGTTPEFDQELTGFIEDASYIRLREIGAYYTIPLENNIIEGVKLGVSGRNLITITDYTSYDPETSTKGGSGLSQGIEVTPFPSSKQIYFHVGLNF